MKNILLFLITSLCYSQFNTEAPWFYTNEAKAYKKSLNKLTFNEQQDLFNKYWETHDKEKKGSGYKVFKRWEYRYENALRKDGSIENTSYLWDVVKKENQDKLLSRKANPISDWKPLGPFTFVPTTTWARGQGRINWIEVDPNNQNIVYIGTPAGGIWKTIDAGNTWTPLSDELVSLGVSGIAIDKTNSNVIYISTGDRASSHTTSIGVLKSTDGGKTWNTTGLTFSPNEEIRTSEIAICPSNNQILFCASSKGLYRSTNGGINWTLLYEGVSFSSGSIRFKPNDPATVYVTSSRSLYKSTDYGVTFSVITTGLPTSTNIGRMILDVTPADNNVVYVMTASTSTNFQGIYKSTNSGTSFAKTSNITDIFENEQAFYDLALCVSDSNPNEIFTGCLNVWKSTDGGNSMSKINQWNNYSEAYTHADIHFLRFINGKLYCGSDGGIYVSNDSGNIFTDKTAGLQISQFYKISIPKTASSKIVGGLQDNGGYSFVDNNWNNFMGADGMEAAISQLNPNLSYSFIQYGRWLYFSDNGVEFKSAINKPAADGRWVTPLKGNSKGEMFAGYNQLFRLQTDISGAPISFVRQNNVASTLPSVNITYIEIAPSDDNIMFVVQNSSLYKSTDKGVNLSFINSFASDITSCAVNQQNPNIVYITTANTFGDVFKSTDGGVTFNQIAPGLPEVSKKIVIHHSNHPNNALYVGTSIGVYYYDDTLTSWVPFDTNLPNVRIEDLEINEFNNTLTAATFGRGIWQTAIQNPLSSDNFEFNNVTISPIPTNGILNINFDAIDVKDIEVYDISGKLIYEKHQINSDSKSIQIDLSAATNGAYFVKLFTENNSIVKKIIKN